MAGAGSVGVSLVRGASAVDTLVASSPLRLLAPANHGLAAWIFAASLGGGLVDGDRIALTVKVGAGAAALVGTQAQTKVDRAGAGAGASQVIEASVEPGGLLVLLPDPVVCFAGAIYAQETRIRLAAGSSLIALEGFTSGRAASGERWEFTRCRTRLLVERDGKPLVVDGVFLDGAHGILADRMGRFDALASIVAIGPRVAGVRADLAAALPKLEHRAPVVAAAAPVGEDGVILRIAGASGEVVTSAVRAALGGLAAVLGDDPFARKW